MNQKFSKISDILKEYKIFLILMKFKRNDCHLKTQNQLTCYSWNSCHICWFRQSGLVSAILGIEWFSWAPIGVPNDGVEHLLQVWALDWTNFSDATFVSVIRVAIVWNCSLVVVLQINRHRVDGISVAEVIKNSRWVGHLGVRHRTEARVCLK